MTASRLLLLLVVYVILDFANPLMPGAVSFDVDESVEGLSGSRHRVASPAPMVVTPAPVRLPPPTAVRPRIPRPPAVPDVVRPPTQARRGLASSEADAEDPGRRLFS